MEKKILEESDEMKIGIQKGVLQQITRRWRIVSNPLIVVGKGRLPVRCRRIHGMTFANESAAGFANGGDVIGNATKIGGIS